MSNMYNTTVERSPISPKISSDNRKTQDVELKVKELTEQVANLQESLNRMTRTIRRQSSDIAALTNVVNRHR